MLIYIHAFNCRPYTRIKLDTIVVQRSFSLLYGCIIFSRAKLLHKFMSSFSNVPISYIFNSEFRKFMNEMCLITFLIYWLLQTKMKRKLLVKAKEKSSESWKKWVRRMLRLSDVVRIFRLLGLFIRWIKRIRYNRWNIISY